MLIFGGQVLTSSSLRCSYSSGQFGPKWSDYYPRNLHPDGYAKKDLESKGFFPEVGIQDFPIRGQKVALCIKRRRWRVKHTGEVISRDWDLVRKGARMTTEFGLFLKGIFG